MRFQGTIFKIPRVRTIFNIPQIIEHKLPPKKKEGFVTNVKGGKKKNLLF